MNGERDLFKASGAARINSLKLHAVDPVERSRLRGGARMLS
jgi:hypothetical protein